MGFEKLNNLVSKFRATNDQQTFRDIYAEVSTERKTNIRMITRSGYGDGSDASEVFDDTVLKLIRRTDIRDFGKTLSVALKLARLHFYRTSKRRTTRYQVGGKTLFPETIEDDMFDLQEYANDRMYTKKEADQRQLIDFLVNDPSQVDSVTTLIVTNFPKYKSVTALAKALGLNHTTVYRKLRSLASRYDANRFGDLEDYLAV
ncbi:hypothetical protein [Paenibacillus agricola]|uniref:TyrR-like helix-turn-helix domain-containing protein n=1 Tax=Paenibacillus agricola TaxID=2716264 RepID=A0ABX0JB53_9BACL|nr:hypothetical protein [Paenibacillus agricola]NHN31181.1 hypothetical protein [Paenibacillus agricola]